MKRIVCLALVFSLTCILPLAAPANNIVQAVQTIVLTGPADSAMLAKAYPTGNLRIHLGVKYSNPGVMADTVGINQAPIGSFSLLIDSAGHISFQVFDPGQSSPARVANGWHVLTSSTMLPPNTDGEVAVEVTAKTVVLYLNGKAEQRTPLVMKLSGQPLYAGDFPGDDGWGPKYNIHPSMTGTLTVKYFGTLTGAPPLTTGTNTVTPSPQEPPQEHGTAIPVPTDTPATIDAGVKNIEDAFRTGSPEAALKLVAPAKRSVYQPIFAAHRAELPRLATLLATRKFVATNGAYAEFTVTEAGHSFPVIFLRAEGTWCLLEL
jgi:hypothetical protein